MSAGNAEAFQRLLSTNVDAGGTTANACTEHVLGGPGIQHEDVVAPAIGELTARLSGGGGDWDLAVFDAGSGATVAGSAYPGSAELAAGYAFEGEELIVQACRRPGASGSPRLEVTLDPIRRQTAAPAPSLLRVLVSSDAEASALLGSGLDVTESAGESFVDVVAHGPADEDVLAGLGLAYVTRVEDLTEPAPRGERAVPRAAGTPARGLPSGRTGSYRRLFDYSEEMKALAARYPRLVRLFTLPHPTYEGRPVQGIEIGRGVRADSGKPAFLQLGLHHAREWPSGEHSLEWAYELLESYRKGREQARELVARTRTIVVPVVNPDGFNASREAGELAGAAAGRGGSVSEESINLVTHPYEFRRKNCRLADDSAAGSCGQPSTGLMEPGVDLNRNYGAFWGGAGASTDPLDPTYRGPAPFSEPEARNIQALFSSRQITAFVTNHTYSALILRPPGTRAQGPSVDEPAFARLGERMSAENGYVSQAGFDLYETTGTTEDWAYYATGSLGFTFEIGRSNFHPPFTETVKEWSGRSVIAPPGGGGNRAAYYELAGYVAQRASHAVIEGRGPRGGTLTVTKSFRTPTSPVLDAYGASGEVQRLGDRLTSTVRIGPRGRFALHVNPSTRPLVAQGGGRERWRLTCRTRAGAVTGTRRLYVERGQARLVDLRTGC